MQCYKIFALSSNSALTNQQSSDDCEGRLMGGAVETDDSVFDACEVLAELGFGDRLSAAPIDKYRLGNGPYGGWQGDVDFHRISVTPGKIVSVNIADLQQPPSSDHPVRSYLAFYDGCGNILATHDYSLERPNEGMLDGMSDEIAANIAIVAPSVPLEPCTNPASSDMYVMVGIDNGNMVMEENTPFDAAHPGTTLSRRFETDLWRQRRYGIGITVLDPVGSVNGSLRMFATPVRGLDANHVSCFLEDNNPDNGSPSCWPPILQIDPQTGRTINVLDGLDFFTTMRHASGVGIFSEDEFISASPLIAYDGRHLWVAVESCGGDSFCNQINHTLFKMDPNALPEEFGYISNMGFIGGFSGDADTSTGMVEVDGYLYILDGRNEVLRWWDKTRFPESGNGRTTIDLTELSGDEPHPKDVFDDVFGDLATDGEMIYMPCSLEGASVGICSFSHDTTLEFVTFEGIIGDPVTNLEDINNDGVPDLTPGPQLGGFDFISDDVLVTSDRNGLIIQHWNMTTDTVTGLKLPREFIIHRISARLESD